MHMCMKGKKICIVLYCEKRWCSCTADLLLCCSRTVINRILLRHVASQLITEPTVGMVVFCIVLYCFVPKVFIQAKRVIGYIKGAAVLLICLCTAISKKLDCVCDILVMSK